MTRIVIAALSVAALVYFFGFDRAHQQTTDANQSRCAAYAAADIDCPYAQ